jgi:hypothetical protein
MPRNGLVLRPLALYCYRLHSARGNSFARDGDEMIEQRLGQQVILPADLRMPLHPKNKLIGSRVDDRLDYAVRRPGYGFEVVTDNVDGLVMMAVDGCVS